MDALLSPGLWFRWSYVEKAEGVFTWYDAQIAYAIAADLTILANINTAGHPAWADDGTGLPKLDKLTNYVTALVDHYEADVHYWEICNEPQSQLYGGFLCRSYRDDQRRIKAADPTAKIVGSAGATTTAWVTSVLAELSGPWSDLL